MKSSVKKESADTAHVQQETNNMPSPETPQKHTKSLITFTVIGVILLGAVVYKLVVTPSKPAHNYAVPVTTAQVNQQDMHNWVSTVGIVTPVNSVIIKSRVDGQLQKILFTEGQEVKAGDILAEIDSRPFVAQLNQAQATLQKDSATLSNLQLDVDRYTHLAAIGAGTGQSLDTSKAQLAAQKAVVAADHAQIETAKLQLNYATLRAPFNGRLGIKQQDVGALIHASDSTGLVTLTQMQPITVLFSLPQQYLPTLLQEQSQQALTVNAFSNDTDTLLDQGNLSFIDNQVDQTNGQFKLKATFTNNQRMLWPGQSVTTKILLNTNKNSLTVPNMAVQIGQQGPYVYIVDDKNIAHVNYVKTGIVDGDFTEIISGLNQNNTVVVNGQNRLKEGAEVHLHTPTTPAATKE